ncbi:MAG: flagellar motor switch protein FliG [Verrucomicrobiia bacterium]
MPALTQQPQVGEVEQSSGAKEVAKMTKIQRLAAFLLIIGAEAAAEIMKYMEEREVEQVVMEMTHLPLLSQEAQKEILREFSSIALEATTGIYGSIQTAQMILEKSLGPNRASDILNRILPQVPPAGAMQRFLELEPTVMAGILKREQPQTIALIVGYLPSDRASKLLKALPENLRGQVIERLATLETTPVDVVERVAAILVQKLEHAVPPKLPAKPGGVKVAAGIMNAVERDISKGILSTLAERNPELARQIRENMFTYEDMIYLDNLSLQKVLREIDMRDLAIALKGTSEELKEKLLGCISKRAAETVLEEISFLGSVKQKEIDAAKQKIIESLRRLEEEGEVDLVETLASAKAVTL